MGFTYQNEVNLTSLSSLSNIVMNSPIATIMSDKEGRIHFFNEAAERLLGYKNEEVDGQSVVNIYASDDIAREIGKKLWESQNFRIDDVEATIKSSTGELIPINLSASFLFDEHGERLGSVGVLRDLREIKEIEAQLLEAEKLSAVGKLALAVGHDIKHDIAIVLNYIEALTYELDRDKERGSELFSVYADIKNALQDVNDKLRQIYQT